MLFKSILTLLLSFNIFYASSLDAALSYDITALHIAKLVVTAKIIPGKDRKYQIVISDILKLAPGITLAVGDKIKVMVPEWGSFGTKSRIYEPEYILYLNPHSNYWFSLYGEHHIKATENNLIPFDICDRTFLLSHNQYKQMLKDIFMCFEYKSEYEYAIKTPFSTYKKTKKPLAVVRELYKCHNDIDNLSQSIEEPYYPELEMPDTTIHAICETDPGLLLSPKEYMDFLSVSIPDSIANNEFDIEGTIYIQMVVEPDSSGSYFKVVRGIHPRLDAFALDIIKGLAPYKPATQRGVAVRCYYYIPVPIRKR